MLCGRGAAREVAAACGTAAAYGAVVVRAAVYALTRARTAGEQPLLKRAARYVLARALLFPLRSVRLLLWIRRLLLCVLHITRLLLWVLRLRILLLLRILSLRSLALRRLPLRIGLLLGVLRLLLNVLPLLRVLGLLLNVLPLLRIRLLLLWIGGLLIRLLWSGGGGRRGCRFAEQALQRSRQHLG